MKKIVCGAFVALCAMSCANDVFATPTQQSEENLKRYQLRTICSQKSTLICLPDQKERVRERGLDVIMEENGRIFGVSKRNGDINGDDIRAIILLVNIAISTWEFPIHFSFGTNVDLSGMHAFAESIIKYFPEKRLDILFNNETTENFLEILMPCFNEIQEIGLCNCSGYTNNQCAALQELGVGTRYYR